MPVAINVFASRRRMLKALEISSYEEWDERLRFFLDPQPPEGILDKLKAIPRVTELAAVFPKTVRSGACQEIVEDGRGRRSREAPGPDLLAGGRGPLHHDAARHHAGPRLGQDERRHVPHAGLRPRDDGHALAEAQGRGRSGAGLRARGPPHGSRRRDRMRPGHGLFRDRAASARASRNFCSPVSCAAKRCRSFPRRPWTCSFPPRPRSFSRATSTRPSAASRAPSAITPASTRWRTTSPSSTSPPSRAAASPST